jgi:hypothetical protein
LLCQGGCGPAGLFNRLLELLCGALLREAAKPALEDFLSHAHLSTWQVGHALAKRWGGVEAV